MITRIEIDGFKSFVDFKLDVPRFLVVMGGNAGGKSNLVDALRVLSDYIQGADPFRPGKSTTRGIPAELFHQFEDETRAESLTIAAECQVDGHGDYPPHQLRIQRSAEYDAATAEIHAPGITEANQSSSGNLDLFMELESWVPLNLVPQLMRERGLITDRGHLQPDGSNLAAVLGRISTTSEVEWQELLADAVALLPELRDIRVERSREYWDLEINSRGSGWMSARTASDGTLRVLAVLAAAHDNSGPSVIVIDEVENGLHPSRLAELIRRLRSISQASFEAGSPRQMILTTHSPVVLSALYPEHENEVVFLSAAYGPHLLPNRKVGSVRTVVRPVGESGLPRAVVRGLLDTVRPLEPER